jgi:diguanylate cyclase (GGDEF)-like protein
MMSVNKLTKKRHEAQVYSLGQEILYDGQHHHVISSWQSRVSNVCTRSQFIDQLQHICQGYHQRDYDRFAVLLLEVDRFQMIRCSLGSRVADQLRAAFTVRVSQIRNTGAVIAHLQDNEFAVLLPGVRAIEESTRFAKQVHDSLRSPFTIAGVEIFLTVSIGITTSDISEQQPSSLLNDAGLAVCNAKMTGGDCCVVFNAALRERTVEQLQLENDIRLGLLRHEFFLHYQPILALETQQLLGFEALVRWQHPRRGLVSPAEFIPVAEATGSIIPLGWWVLKEACRQLKVWQQQFPNTTDLTINVNLSGQQFSQPHFIEQIDEILRLTGVEGRHLKLEITETVLMENADLAAQVLDHLKARGIRLCIDDFGTGYSSLSYLQRFEISTLKIDRSFVARMETDSKSVRILQIIMMLAYQLKMDVVAEGIETSEQYWQLRALQCQHGQGYLFSKPISAETVVPLLTNAR